MPRNGLSEKLYMEKDSLGEEKQIHTQDKLISVLPVVEDNELFTENHLEGEEHFDYSQITPPLGFEHVKPKFLPRHVDNELVYKWDNLIN